METVVEERVVEEPIQSPKFIWDSHLTIKKIVSEKNPDIEIKRNDNPRSYTMRTKAQGNIAHFYEDPTGNCQIQTIAYFKNLLIHTNLEDTKELIWKFWENSSMKTMLLVDLEMGFTNKMKELFTTEEIVIEAPYHNNTGTEMCIWLVQVKEMLRRIGKDV